MELPDDIIHIIREYSKPLTRPDWRTLDVMSDFKFLMLLKPYEKYNCKTIHGDDFYYFQIGDIDLRIINNSLTQSFHQYRIAS